MSREGKQGGGDGRGAADLAARALAFVESPDGARFVALRDELRAAGRGELLAAVCAAFAGSAIGPHAAAAWSEAGETYLVIGDVAAGKRALERALLTDPQTSGGLLVACAPEVVTEVLAIFLQEGFDHATVIGEIAEGKPHVAVVRSH